MVDLNIFLRGIGRNLVSLNLRGLGIGAIKVIEEYCPNLRYLEVCMKEDQESDEELIESIKERMRSVLKRLAKLKVNDAPVRLGTDWEGT